MSGLPSASSSSAWVDVTIVSAGALNMPGHYILKDAPEDLITIPDYAFLIEHKTLGKKVFFDVGMAKDLSIYTPAAQYLFEMFSPIAPAKSLAEIAEAKGIKREEIQQVIFSHIHFDHCSPFSSYLPNATALFGPGSIEAARPGYPAAEKSMYFAELHDPNHPWSKNVEELRPLSESGWKPFGPFEHAWDLWGDGSFWLINAPGHVAGNLAAAARLKDGDWIIMGGDCAHARPLMLGKADIGEWKDSEGNVLCMHADKEMAKKTMRKIRELDEMEGVHVALAHVSLEELGNPKLNSLLWKDG